MRNSSDPWIFPASLDLWIVGPVDPANAARESKAPETHSTTVQTSRDFLRLGLDRTARVNMKLQSVLDPDGKAPPWMDIRRICAFNHPLDPATVTAAHVLGKRVGLNDDDARAWAGGLISLAAFFQTAQGVPSFREMAREAVAMPSVWTMMKEAVGKSGPNVNFNLSARVVQARWMNAPSECYSLPFALLLGEKPVTWVGILVTDPKPPLDLSAGIISLQAVNPKDQGRNLQLSLVAVQR